MPVVRPPDPTTMAKAGLRHGYVTRAGRVVKPEHYTYLYTVKSSVKKKIIKTTLFYNIAMWEPDVVTIVVKFDKFL